MRLAYQGDYILAAYQYDLRAQRAALKKVYEDNKRMRIMFEASPFSIYLLDLNANVIDCNKISTDFFGMKSKKDFIENFKNLLPEHQPCGKTSFDKINEINAEVLAKGSYFINEWLFQKLDGEPLLCEVFLMLVKYEEKDAIAAYIRDLKEYKLMLNEKRKAEIAEASNKAKSKFLAAMSHEIRTPMNAILGLAEINMQNDALPEEIQEEFEKIYNSGDLLMHLINDILDLSKIEAGKLEIRYGQYSIASLIHDAVQLNITRIGSKPIEFKLDLDEKIPSELIGDELRIKQILNNLLSNAFKYTDNGSIMLSVAAEPAKDNEEAILIFDVAIQGRA
jgi:signal transduction histidine kinase